MTPEELKTAFQGYFKKAVASQAAESLKEKARIGIVIPEENQEFTFKRLGGENVLEPGLDPKAQIIFKIPLKAAESILGYQSENIGEIGVHIAKMIVSQDPEKKIRIQLKTGLIDLTTSGYLGVVAKGGAAFASFLATRGLGGMKGIKKAVQELKKGT